MKDMGFRGVAFLGVFLVLDLFVACGGGSDEEASGDGDGDMGGAAPTLKVECVPAPGIDEADAVCFNDSDCALIDSETLRDTAGDCLKNSCLGNEDEGGCTADCIVDEVAASPECAACYGVSAACSAENCLSECFADKDAPECRTCQLASGCFDEYLSCSGLTRIE
jgi:hypothetical protein